MSLILDEVVTGLDMGSSTQDYYDVMPDLATYGKIIGGGLQLDLLRVELTSWIKQIHQIKVKGYVYQNGTLQGHMLGCVAGMATLDVLSEDQIYKDI